MGVILKYQLKFPEADLKVSNDLLLGDFILDADIKIAMNRGKAGGSFEIKLYDLPMEKAKDLQKQVGKFAQVVIKLGYFDDPFEEVMTGVVREIHTAVQGDKLVTSLKGYEIAGYALRNSTSSISIENNTTIDEAVKKVLQDAKLGEEKITLQHKVQDIPDTLGNLNYKNERLIKCLDDLAQRIQSEFFVIDKTVWLGKPIKNDESYKPPEFDPDTNLAVYSLITKDVEKNIFKEGESDYLAPTKVEQVEGFRFVILGDPKLRPGQKVSAAIDKSVVDIFASFEKVEFRVHSLVHNFTTSGGYTCEGSAIKACTGGDCRSREAMLAQPNAEGVAERIGKRSEAEQRNRPLIEIGKVKSYTSGEPSTEKSHLSNLYFGQRFEDTETQPSIHVEVDNFDQQLFRDKPISSPFAWHKCGLVTPIYPGMTALLNHNLNLQDDAVIAGFIWSKKTGIEPPKNKEGDWWLCLPIDPSNPLSDSTKAVNDLTANNGKRVIEVKGLKITVGGELQSIGDRPEEGGDDEFLIQHKSGTILKIAADGSLTIEAKSISIKGDVKIQGSVDIK